MVASVRQAGWAVRVMYSVQMVTMATSVLTPVSARMARVILSQGRVPVTLAGKVIYTLRFL